jgi:hypothetical protein
MTNNQLFFALVTVLVAGFGFVKYYIDAKIDYVDAKLDPIKSYIAVKIDPIALDVKRLIDYMILHEGKIARLEEKTKSL